jgi:hypothetical protein
MKKNIVAKDKLVFLPGKWPGLKADHSTPTSAEVRKICIHSPKSLHGVVLN